MSYYDREHGRARRSDPDTAHRAAARVKAEPMRQQVLELLTRYPRGLTTGEMAIKCGKRRDSFSPRMTELEPEGLVVRLEEQRAVPGYDESEVWRIRRVGERITKKRNPLRAEEYQSTQPVWSPGDPVPSKPKEPSVKTQTSQGHKPRVRIDTVEPKANGHDKGMVTLKESLLTKYRPTGFKEIIGQDDAIASTKSTLAAGVRVLVFHGPPGTGKTTLALCTALEHLGLTLNDITPIDGARYNTVEAMNEVAEMFEHPPMLGAVRVLMIDECHRITRDGWTVLLAALENVPPWLYVFFCTTEIDKVPKNIQSQRATAIRLELVGTDDIFYQLDTIVEYEGWKTPEEVIALCAQEAAGSPRRGLSLLSKVTHCKTRDEAARILGVTNVPELQSDYGYRIAKALQSPLVSDIQSLILEAEEAKASPVGIRFVIRSYYKTVWCKARDKQGRHYAARVLSHLEEPVEDFPSLVLALYMIIGETDGE